MSHLLENYSTILFLTIMNFKCVVYNLKQINKVINADLLSLILATIKNQIFFKMNISCRSWCIEIIHIPQAIYRRVFVCVVPECGKLYLSHWTSVTLAIHRSPCVLYHQNVVYTCTKMYTSIYDPYNRCQFESSIRILKKQTLFLLSVYF